MANIILDAAKSSGVSSTVVLNPGDQIVLTNFDLSEAEKVFVNEAGQLVIVLPDGTQFFITNFVANLTANPDAIVIIDETGQGISFSDLVAQYIDNAGEEEVEPALGATDAPLSSGSSRSGGSDAALNSDLSQESSGLSTFDTSGPTTFTPNSSSGPTPAPSSTVTTSNVAPSANNGSVTGAEDTTFNLGIADPRDVDNASNTLTITVTSLPDTSAGFVQLNGVNVTVGQVLTNAELTSLTFAPTANYNGTVAFNYNVTDSSNATTPSTQQITVSAVQDAPEFSGTSSTTIDEDASSSALNMTIPTDADTPYGDVLSVTITTALSAIEGVITLDGNAITQNQTFTTDELSRLQITPNANYNGSFTINYTATDSANNTASSTHTVTVNAVNDAPVATNSTSTQDEDTSQVDLNITAPTDVDNATITTTLDALPTNGTLYYADGTTPVAATDILTVAQLTSLKFTPNANYNGTVVINYTVTDGSLTSSASHTITVTPVNDAPVATSDSSTQAEDSTDVTLNITLPTDIDDATLVARIDTLPTEGTLKFANGTTVVAGVDFDSAELATITFTPNANYNGTVAINYTVEDAGGLTSNATHTVTVTAVNDAPTTENSTSNQDEDTSQVDLNITAPTDVDGDTISITLGALPTDGTLYYADGTTPVGASDTLTVAQLTGLKFTPNANYNGTVAISYTATDGTLTSTATHTITVNAVNDLPVTSNSTSTQFEDSAATTLGITTPTDVDGDTIYANIATLPTEGTLRFVDGSAVPQNTQFLSSELAGITFTPNANYNGTVVINYTVTDNNSAPVAATHTVNVNAQDDAPVATNSTSTQDEDSSQVALNITAPIDGDNDVLSITLDALPTDGTLYYADGTTPVGASDTLTVEQLTGLKFTPNANYNGTVVINYTVTDGDAGTADATASHTITVTSINDAPVTTDSTSMQMEDSVDRMIVLPTPTDVENDPMQFSITSFADGVLKLANGNIVTVGTLYPVSEIGGLTFTPNKDYNGTVVIKYSVTDGTDTTDATHTITVVGENDAPIVVDSSSTQDEDSVTIALNIPKPTDPENDALTVITSLPSNGTLYYADGTTVVGTGDELTVDQLAGLRFTPDANFNGVVEINYTVDDGGLVTNGTHTVTVTSINDAPDVVNSTSTQDEDTSAVALNIPVATDVDGDALRFTVGTLPTQGTLTFSDGSPVVAGASYQIADIAGLRFTPNANYNGTVVINYSVSDGTTSVDANHTITVNSINDAPVTTDSSSNQDEDTSQVDLNITAPTDVDNATIITKLDALPTDGTLYYADGTTPVGANDSLTVDQLTTLKFTPNANYNGTVVINYTVTDGITSTPGTHTITVNSVNDAPDVTNSTSSQDQDSAQINLNITAPTDVDGDTLTTTFSSLPTNGTLYYADGTTPVVISDTLTVAQLTTLKFTPDAGYDGTVVLNYSVSDGTVSVPGTHTITVNPTNVAPVAYDSSSTQNEDTTSNINIQLPTDADGDTLFVTINSLPTNGTLYFANGSPVPTGIQFSANELSGFKFTPNANYHGTTSLTYTVSDGKLTSNGTHTINVASVPDAIATNSDPLEDNVNHLNFDSVLRAAERYDCVVNGRFQIDAEYQYNTLIAGSSFYYDLPSNVFSSTDGTALSYSGTYTYNGQTHSLGSWISVNSSTGDLSGYFPSSLNGLVTFNITATNVDGLTSTKSITYNIMSQADFNSIDVIGPKYGNYLLPENTSNNLMVGVDDAGVLRYDILTTGTGITADLIKGYVNKQNGYTDLIDNYNTIYGTSHNDTFTASDAYNNIIAGSGYDVLKVYAQNHSDNGHIYVSGGSLNISGIEEISMENGKTNETLHINSSSLLSQSGSGYIKINGDVYNTAADDNVQFSDKSAAQISSASAGTTNSGGINYHIYNFSTGTVYIETGLDILDASGHQVV